MDFSVFAFCHATNCLCSILAFWPFLLLSLYYFSLLIFWRYSCFPLSFILKFIFPLLTFFCPFHFLFSAMFSTLLSWLHFLLVFLSPILEFFHPFSFFITWVLLYGVIFLNSFSLLSFNVYFFCFWHFPLLFTPPPFFSAMSFFLLPFCLSCFSQGLHFMRIRENKTKWWWRVRGDQKDEGVIL